MLAPGDGSLAIVFSYTHRQQHKEISPFFPTTQPHLHTLRARQVSLPLPGGGESEREEQTDILALLKDMHNRVGPPAPGLLSHPVRATRRAQTCSRREKHPLATHPPTHPFNTHNLVT
jgi:hypothetical protein